MSAGTGLFLLGVWIAFAAAIASPWMGEDGYNQVKRIAIIITTVVCAAVFLANLYRL